MSRAERCELSGVELVVLNSEGAGQLDVVDRATHHRDFERSGLSLDGNGALIMVAGSHIRVVSVAVKRGSRAVVAAKHLNRLHVLGKHQLASTVKYSVLLFA